MIVRRHYRGWLVSTDMDEAKLETCMNKDRLTVANTIGDKMCLTVALYRYENMLFLYYEALDEKLKPEQLFPQLSAYMELWPEKDGKTSWAYMYNIYYHSIPESEEHWARHGKKVRRGRIAYLFPDKLFSYTYWHKAIVEEGLLEGDQYQSIALHENILFSYFEEPKIFTHIKKEVQKESSVINGWIGVNPESHFDHCLSGESNFLLIDELFSMGVEDLKS